jgi:hypothetical protein
VTRRQRPDAIVHMARGVAVPHRFHSDLLDTTIDSRR